MNGSWLPATKDAQPPASASSLLPAPEGAFYLIIRLYAAKPEVLAGKWTPLPVHKITLTN